jgi:spore coat polysaccharide biosynthesis protein SpsF
MGSSRLPGKVLMDVNGRPMLQRVLERAKRIRRVDQVVLASTTAPADRDLLELAARLGCGTYAGSEEDVLDRFYQAATQHHADVVMRITADCPVLDPKVNEAVLDRFLKGNVDFVCNVTPPSYPDGLDTWVFSYAALADAWRHACLKSEREHVTPFIWTRPERFRLANVAHAVDLSHLRWTVDDDRDLKFIRRVYERLEPSEGPFFGLESILSLLSCEPELSGVNAGTMRDAGYAKSLREDTVVKTPTNHLPSP